MKEWTSVLFLGIAILALAGCSRQVPPVPAALIDAVKQRAFKLPKDHILISDGSKPEYIMVVRQLQDTPENRQMLFPTNSVLGEWFFANKYENPDAVIKAVKELGTDGLFSVHFLVAQVSDTSAEVYVFVSYGDRGGHSRKWSFAKVKDEWKLATDDRTGYWD